MSNQYEGAGVWTPKFQPDDRSRCFASRTVSPKTFGGTGLDCDQAPDCVAVTAASPVTIESPVITNHLLVMAQDRSRT